MASLGATTMLERKQEEEDANLDRKRFRYRAAMDEYRRCQPLGIAVGDFMLLP